MRDFFLAGIVGIFLPGAVEGFPINRLSVLGKMMLDREGQIVIRHVRHSIKSIRGMSCEVQPGS